MVQATVAYNHANLPQRPCYHLLAKITLQGNGLLVRQVCTSLTMIESLVLNDSGGRGACNSTWAQLQRLSRLVYDSAQYLVSQSASDAGVNAKVGSSTASQKAKHAAKASDPAMQQLPSLDTQAAMLSSYLFTAAASGSAIPKYAYLLTLS
jgi:hypothetical protein